MEWIGSLVSGKSFDSSASNGGTKSDKEQYEAVIDKLKKLYDTPRDDEGRMIKDELKNRIEVLFDKSLVHLVEGQEEALGYDEYVAEMEQFCEVEFDFKLFRYKHLEPGILDEYVLWGSSHTDVQVFGKMHYNSQGMIHKAEIKRILTNRVAGQITAKADQVITNMIPNKDKSQDNSKSQKSSLLERDFAHNVHPLPSLVHEQYLYSRGEATGLLPTLLSYEYLKVHLQLVSDDSIIYKRSHQIKLTDDSGQPYANGAFFQFKRSSFPSVKTLTLFSGGNDEADPEAIAFCEKKHEIWTIYGTRALRPSNEDHVKMIKCRRVRRKKANKLQKEQSMTTDDNATDVVAFYPWFRLTSGKSVNINRVRNDEDGFGFLSVLADTDDAIMGSNKDSYEPAFAFEAAKEGDRMIGFMRDYDDPEHKQQAVFRFKSTDNAKKKNSDKAEVLIAPGVDPTMTLCVAACSLHLS